MPSMERTAITAPLTALLEGNARYSERAFPGPLPMVPARRLVVLSCVDPRIDPACVLDLRQGDAVVIRNVGGRVTPAVMHTLSMLQTISRADDVGPTETDAWAFVILQHTDCGITRLADRPDLLAAYFGGDVDEVASRHVTDPYAAVADDVARLVQAIAPQFTVIGMVHDLHTGRVEVIDTRP